MLGKLIRIHLVAQHAQLVHLLRKSADLLLRGGTCIQPRLLRTAHHIQVCPVMLHCVCRHFFHCRLADTASRESDDTQQRFVVPRVDCDAEIAQRVFDLLALVERCAAIDAVRYVPLPQFALKRTALRVRPIQDSDIVVAVFASRIAADLLRYAFRLRAVVHIGLQLKETAFLFLGIHLFLYLMYVLVYQRIGRTHDCPCRAVVALQFEEFRFGILLLEI